MPQIKLEYSDNIKTAINFPGVMLHIHEIIAGTISSNIEDCKSRIIKLDNYFIAHGETDNAMVHLEVNILEGRSEELKSELGNKLLSFLETVFENVSGVNLQITIEIKDIVRENYFKTVIT